MTARRAESCYVIARQEEEIGLPSITDRKSRHQLERSILESVEAYLLERLGIPFTLTEYSWVRSQLYQINDAEELMYRPSIEVLEGGAARVSAGYQSSPLAQGLLAVFAQR
jgi:hypothetical protein